MMRSGRIEGVSKRLAQVLAAVACAMWVGCGNTGTPPPVEPRGTSVMLEVPRGGVMPDFFSLPFPTDLRWKADGTLDLKGFPKGLRPDAIGTFIETFGKETRAASTGGAAYFRFGGAIDASTLPTSATSTTASASAFIIDVDPASPTRGQRHPLQLRYWATASVFVPANVVALLPYPGLPLRPKNKYAAVVTSAVKDAAGQPLVANLAWTAVKAKTASTDVDVERVRVAYAPALDALEAAGVMRADVVGLAAFTTQDPTAELRRMHTWLGANTPTPTLAEGLVCAVDSRLPYVRCDGEYETPNYRAGTPPYATEGGNLVFDAMGNPVAQGRERMRFVITLPKTEPPAAGFPVALVSHGTGGSRESLLGTNDTGHMLAQRGIAAIGIDQPLQGARDTFCPEGAEARENCENFNTFNPFNFVAARDNFRQGAIDNFFLTRFVKAVALPKVATGTLVDVRFDAQKLLFFGHSQGGIVGPLFVGVEPSIKGAVFSGGGAMMGYGLLFKTNPIDIRANIEELVLGLPEGTTELELAHPLITLVQGFIDSADPLNYADSIVTRPPTGQACKDVLVTEGLTDTYTPNAATEALATSLGVSPVQPVLQSVLGLELRGRASMAAPVTANATCTAVLAQYARAADAASNGSHDGHFVVYWNSVARRQYSDFLKTVVENGRATFPTP